MASSTVRRSQSAHPGDLEGRKVFAEGVFWVATWMIISPAVIIQIKNLVTTPGYEFHYSWGFLGFSNIITYAAAWVTMKIFDAYNGGQTSLVPVEWDKGLLLGVLHGLEVGLGAVVIRAVSVQLRTEIHMMAPALMYVGGLAAGIESPAPALVLSVVLITCGGAMSLSGHMGGHNTMDLVPVAILSGLCACTRWVLTQRWLAPKGSALRPSPMMLLTRMTPGTSLTGFVGALVFERQMYSQFLSLPEPQAVWIRIFFIGIAVVFMTCAELRVCQLFSALLLGMLTPFHNLTIIVYGIIHTGASSVTPYNWAGIALCTGATVLYSWARHEESKHVISKVEAQELREPFDVLKVEDSA